MVDRFYFRSHDAEIGSFLDVVFCGFFFLRSGFYTDGVLNSLEGGNHFTGATHNSSSSVDNVTFAATFATLIH